MAKDIILSAEKRDGKVFVKLPKDSAVRTDKDTPARNIDYVAILLLIVGIVFITWGVLDYFEVLDNSLFWLMPIGVGVAISIVSIDRLFQMSKLSKAVKNIKDDFQGNVIFNTVVFFVTLGLLVLTMIQSFYAMTLPISDPGYIGELFGLITFQISLGLIVLGVISGLIFYEATRAKRMEASVIARRQFIMALIYMLIALGLMVYALILAVLSWETDPNWFSLKFQALSLTIVLVLLEVYPLIEAMRIWQAGKEGKWKKADATSTTSTVWILLIIAGLVVLALAIFIFLNILPMPVWFPADNSLYFGIIFAIAGAGLGLGGLIPLIRMPTKPAYNLKKEREMAKSKGDKAQQIIDKHFFLRSINDGKRWFTKQIDHHGYGSIALMQFGIVFIISLFFMIFAYFFYGNSISAMVGFLGFAIAINLLALSAMVPILGTIVAFWTYVIGSDLLVAFFQLPNSWLTDLLRFLMFLGVLIVNIIVTLIFFGSWAIRKNYPELAFLSPQLLTAMMQEKSDKETKKESNWYCRNLAGTWAGCVGHIILLVGIILTLSYLLQGVIVTFTIPLPLTYLVVGIILDALGLFLALSEYVCK